MLDNVIKILMYICATSNAPLSPQCLCSVCSFLSGVNFPTERHVATVSYLQTIVYGESCCSHSENAQDHRK